MSRRALFSSAPPTPEPAVLLVAPSGAERFLRACAADPGLDVLAEAPLPGEVHGEVGDPEAAIAAASCPVGAFSPHEPLVRAAARHHPRLGLLHIGAEAHLHPEGWIRRVADAVVHVAQVGVQRVDAEGWAWTRDREGVATWHEDLVRWELAGGDPWRHVAQRVARPLPDAVWVAIEPDGLALRGGPGLSLAELGALLRVLCAHQRRVVGFSLYDFPDPTDAARVAHRLAAWAAAGRRLR